MHTIWLQQKQPSHLKSVRLYILRLELPMMPWVISERDSSKKELYKLPDNI